ncbi:MAG: hypothetical protein AAF709_14015 [Pseudomonadota bacterium]
MPSDPDADIQALAAIGAELRATASEGNPLAAHIRSHPGLAWLKRCVPPSAGSARWEYIMAELSDQYVLRILGGKREHYIGKTDHEIWDFDEAEVFWGYDDETRRGVRNPTEPVNEPWTSRFTRQQGTFRGKKWTYEFDGTIWLAGAD